MRNKTYAAIISVFLVFLLSACSPAEAVVSWIDGLAGLLPNDVEAALGSDESIDEDHEFTLSTGYVNMLKNGTWHITYTLDDGRTAAIASNGAKYASTYRENLEDAETETQTDADGNEITVTAPQEHIVLSDGTYYWVDDTNNVLYKVNPANYLAVPIEISVSGISLSEKGEKEYNGKKCTYEKYKTDNGPITFYYHNLTISDIVIEQSGTYELKNITSIDKYIGNDFFALPESYSVVDAWK